MAEILILMKHHPAIFSAVFIEAFDHECKVPFGTVIFAITANVVY